MDMQDDRGTDLSQNVNAMGRRARDAARALALASTAEKNEALLAMADAIKSRSCDILAANVRDRTVAAGSGKPYAHVDRLTLDEGRLDAMVVALREIAALPDPVGEVISVRDRPNGLHIERVRTPLGVIGIIFEARPNVTVDAAALCLKAGNACILRPGSDCFATSQAIALALTEGLRRVDFPCDAVQLVPDPDRAVVGMMLQGLEGCIDVIVPRGGKSLVERVMAEATVPVFSHLEGVCHVYVHEKADPDMAVRIVVNSKMRRPGICGAAEALLVDQSVVGTHLPPLVSALIDAGCVLRGDETACMVDSRVCPADEEDWGREFLDAVIAVRVVAHIDEAIEYIATHGSSHTDAIVTDDPVAAARFLDRVDSAIVIHNASTQFADGGEFGMGAEIGIATGRLHARGPIGVEQLTCFKYHVRGTGQIRS